jgi:hypothetical protein
MPRGSSAPEAPGIERGAALTRWLPKVWREHMPETRCNVLRVVIISELIELALCQFAAIFELIANLS